MGYNGGINKRGYYRREHGMGSKSAYNSGSRMLTNLLFGGLGLIALGGQSLFKAIEDTSSNFSLLSDDIKTSKKEHFNPKRQKTRFLILGIIALLCPIIGFCTYEFADWWMFFSVLVFGSIETTVCALNLPSRDISKYINKDEQELVETKCKSNLKILRAFLIMLLILNLYPIVLLILDFIPFNRLISINETSHLYFMSWEGSGITIVLVILKLLLNAVLIAFSFSKDPEMLTEYGNIIAREEVQNNNKSKKQQNRMEIIPQADTPHLDSSSSEPSVKLKGRYTESLSSGGELHVSARGWSIQYYFPGPDRRYNGTSVSIYEEQIDKYIEAWKHNFQKYEELKATIPEEGNFETYGEMGMHIRIGFLGGVCLKDYHMPIRTADSLQKVLEDYEYAKQKAALLAKLF